MRHASASSSLSERERGGGEEGERGRERGEGEGGDEGQRRKRYDFFIFFRKKNGNRT